MRPSGPVRLRSLWLLLAAFWITIVGAKFILIRGWGSDVPYWDQWDGIGERIFLKQAEGSLSWADFFHPHNEHRIVYTRLLSLALLDLNGQWDSRLEMMVNALLHAGALTFLLLIASRALPRVATGALALFCAVLFALPFAAENTLAAFQSQFYFILWFAFAHIAGSGLAWPGSRWWWLGQLAGAAGLFAMASGFLSALIVGALTVARCLSQRRRPTGWEWFSMAWGAAVVVAGVLLRTDVPGHAILRAQSLAVWLESVAWLTAWPVASPWWFGITIVPIAVVTVRAWQTKFTHYGFTLGSALGGWCLLQAALLAYGRGGESHALAPRYFDLLAVAVFTGALAWLVLLSHYANVPGSRRKRMIIVSAAVWLVAIGSGLRRQTGEQWNGLKEIPAINASREQTLADFLSGRLPTLEGKRPWYDLPFPEAHWLEDWLRIPAMRNLMPASIRAPLPLVEASTQNGFRKQKLPAPECIAWISSERTTPAATWTSEPIHTKFPLLRFKVVGELAPPLGAVMVVSGQEQNPVQPQNSRRSDWGQVTIEAPRGEFRVHAESAPQYWLGFSAPIEVGQLTWLAAQSLKLGRYLFFVGATTLVIIFARQLWQSIRATKMEIKTVSE